MHLHTFNSVIAQHANGNLIARHVAGIRHMRVLLNLMVNIPGGKRANRNSNNQDQQITHMHWMVSQLAQIRTLKSKIG